MSTVSVDAVSLPCLPRRIHNVIDDHVKSSPGHTALIEGQVVWSYDELHRSVGEVAAALQALGVRPGDRMMIVSENGVALASLLLAASRIDAWAIVVNPRLSFRELDQIRGHSGARRMFFVSTGSKEAAAHATVYDAQKYEIGPLSEIDVSALNDSTTTESVAESSTEQVAVLIYTSGTTGTPKGVMLTHENLVFSARCLALSRKQDADDINYIVLPMSHIVGISLLIMTLMTGGTARLVAKYDPGVLLKALAANEATILNGVPATFQRLLDYKTTMDLPPIDRGRLRLVAVAGAPLDLDLKSRVEKEFGLPLLNGYGITECSPGISGVFIDAPRADQSVGRLHIGVEAKLITSEGALTQNGVVGELHVRGRNVMRGYYREPDLTAKAIDAGGWFNTGDLARFEDDHMFIVGRTKEMIIRSGFNVYPAEIEAVINSHHAVVQSAVVGRKVDSNEEVVAFVQLAKDSSVGAIDLMDYIKPKLTSYKRPSEIIVLETFPATSTGKILKHKLAESLR